VRSGSPSDGAGTRRVAPKCAASRRRARSNPGSIAPTDYSRVGPLSSISFWSLVVGRWSLVVGHWSLVVGHWSLVIGRWSLVVGRWSLVRLGTNDQRLMTND